MILAIDAGNIESGYALIDNDFRPVRFGKVTNREMEYILNEYLANDEKLDMIALEMVASYGMPAGATLFDTCVAIGRFEYIAEQIAPVRRVKRKQYVTDLCGDSKAKDANVIQYLIDRFAPNTPNRGKGTKKERGWFYGFKADEWQAYALAVWALDEKRYEDNYIQNAQNIFNSIRERNNGTSEN